MFYACGGSSAAPPPPAAAVRPAPRPAETAPTASSPHVATAASQPAPAPSAREEPPATARKATLHYELNGRKFPLPLVHGSIAGTSTWMLVDTGASSHVVAGWLARQAKLPLKKAGDLGADHAGRSITTFRVEHPQAMIDEWGSLADAPMLATEVPPLIEQMGIGAFISPQQLVESEGDAVVLDLLTGELHGSKYDEATRKLAHRGSALAPTGGHACEDDATPIKGLTFVLPAKVDGRNVSLLLDTGAQRSDLLLGSAVGRALTPRSIANKDELYAASGRMTSRTVRGARVALGEFAVTRDIGLIPGSADPYCARDGVVSMDVLRSCVLVLGRTKMFGKCAPVANGAH